MEISLRLIFRISLRVEGKERRNENVVDWLSCVHTAKLPFQRMISILFAIAPVEDDVSFAFNFEDEEARNNLIREREDTVEWLSPSCSGNGYTPTEGFPVGRRKFIPNAYSPFLTLLKPG